MEFNCSEEETEKMTVASAGRRGSWQGVGLFYVVYLRPVPIQSVVLSVVANTSDLKCYLS